MKKLLATVAVLTLLLMVSIGIAQDARAEHNHEEEDVLYWTCGMHPSIRSDKPGNCPICNMKLVPVKKTAPSDTLQSGEDTTAMITISPEAARLAMVRTVPARRIPLVKRLISYGNVTLDETSIVTVTARVSGRIEKLFANYTGKEIDEGDPIASIYSPELLTAQKELLLTKNSQLKSLAEKKLLLWGITESQIAEILRSGEIQDYLTIYSPITGTVIKKNISEGDYLREGDILLTLAELSSVWIEAEVFERDVGFVRAGQKAKVYSDACPGISFDGVISFIDPVIDEATRSTKARIVVDNRDRKLLPGAFVRVEISIPATEWIENAKRSFSENRQAVSTNIASAENKTLKEMATSSGTHMTHMENGEKGTGGILALPRSAIINTGKRSVAFVEIREGQYEMRRVTIGPQVNDYYIILEGINEGELVVEHGNFLIDSQSQLTGFAEEAYGGAISKESKKASASGVHHH